MTLSVQSFFSILAALCGAITVHSLLSWLINRPPSITRSLKDYAFSPSDAQVPDVSIGSPAHRIRLAFAGFGLDVSGREQFSLYLAVAIFGMGLAIGAVVLGLPAIFWLVGPAIAYFAVNSLVNRKWNNIRKTMEKEIPSYLMNLSSVIQLNPNVVQALEDASLSLDPSAPFRPWIERLAHSIQSQGKKGLEEMQAEAGDISPTLMLLVVEISRLWETGGIGFTQSFQLVSENLAGILEGRSKASAKADGAWGTIRVIIVALGGAIFLAFSSPGSSAMFRTPTAQIAIVVAVAWAGFGFSYISDLIRESVE
jgi:Flp pilus assembly protein TadB